MICKFQVDSTGKKVLIYNEDKSWSSEIEGEIGEDLISVLMLKPLSKTFFECEDQGDKTLKIDGRVEDPGW